MARPLDRDAAIGTSRISREPRPYVRPDGDSNFHEMPDGSIPILSARADLPDVRGAHDRIPVDAVLRPH